MKTKSDLSYKQAILLGVATELTLVAIQFVYMKIFVSNNPGTDFVFTNDYMKSRGFYIFQVVGFFVYTATVYLLFNKFQITSITKILAYILTGAVIELSFYLFMQTGYEGAFLYSILDKFIAAVFGSILYYSTSGKSHNARNMKKV